MDTLAESSWVSDTAVTAFGYTNYEETSYYIANVKGDTPITGGSFFQCEMSSVGRALLTLDCSFLLVCQKHKTEY